MVNDRHFGSKVNNKTEDMTSHNTKAQFETCLLTCGYLIDNGADFQKNSWKIGSIGRDGSTCDIESIPFLWQDKRNSQICRLTYSNSRNLETIQPVVLKIVMQINHIVAIEASVWAALVFVLLSVCHLLWVVQMQMRSHPSARLPALWIPLDRQFPVLRE